METWKILLISLSSVIVAGCVGGVVIGKHLVKRARNGARKLLSTKERIVYASCLALGAALILFGIFFKFPAAQNPDMTGGMDMLEEGAVDGGDFVEGKGIAGGEVIIAGDAVAIMR